jgi:hypothetical protein
MIRALASTVKLTTQPCQGRLKECPAYHIHRLSSGKRGGHYMGTPCQCKVRWNNTSNPLFLKACIAHFVASRRLKLSLMAKWVSRVRARRCHSPLVKLLRVLEEREVKACVVCVMNIGWDTWSNTCWVWDNTARRNPKLGRESSWAARRRDSKAYQGWKLRYQGGRGSDWSNQWRKALEHSFERELGLERVEREWKKWGWMLL